MAGWRRCPVKGKALGSLAFYLAFWAASYALLHFVQANAFVLGADIDHLDLLGLLLFLLFSTAATGAAWLLLQPSKIIWRKGPRWPYPIIALGFLGSGR